ncbi:hypothetical protein GLOIN_2v1787297 [Rhizophagus irregularis DAOM 181602=DAOM 197198]|uniref:Uncharacterized protein n=1 Tax=Rhizophagus irregularis (strain DAOM 181602 / DAOM 197198 / MUCL 43194) TaxID=747089 RepID=A0A2P4P663_RHIID|nr:hypothetical protein GLOIN_2v1787297 [Rhizophagus irregularis DAOM 181602=DAOM 197198]POG60875.1 hypothetical protein GLOIN_2v1787297 [Rhizophagus irregularis DAOM 181602=DAOM 197198]GET58511.1 hypothetical protein GLOIN_2v1787297 [Rhizophagus irregularis DAOM 181602=DAOM 197198]|eukprot:XP_025167741.1 hypothetical protein GLOIN_2v1787297 [Rhizophagus irregularis DAOM 181602=DAOM 197198]
MNAVYKSGMEDEIGQGLQLKSQDKLNGRTAISSHRGSTRRGQTIMYRRSKLLKEGDNTNENKKRVAQIQGSRGDDNSEGSE